MVNSQFTTHDSLYTNAVNLLKKLIATPSFSREEDGTATIIQQFFTDKNIPAKRFLNNIWAINKYFDPLKPTLLLNSHHDTVKPNPKYTKNPFEPIIEDEKLYGLGSNDASGCLVALLEPRFPTRSYFRLKQQAYLLLCHLLSPFTK